MQTWRASTLFRILCLAILQKDIGEHLRANIYCRRFTKSEEINWGEKGSSWTTNYYSSQSGGFSERVNSRFRRDAARCGLLFGVTGCPGHAPGRFNRLRRCFIHAERNASLEARAM